MTGLLTASGSDEPVTRTARGPSIFWAIPSNSRNALTSSGWVFSLAQLSSNCHASSCCLLSSTWASASARRDAWFKSTSSCCNLRRSSPRALSFAFQSLWASRSRRRERNSSSLFDDNSRSSFACLFARSNSRSKCSSFPRDFSVHSSLIVSSQHSFVRYLLSVHGQALLDAGYPRFLARVSFAR